MVGSDHRTLEREASRAADLLDAGLRYFGGATVRPVDGREAAMRAWRGRVAADASLKPTSTFDMIVAEAVAAHDAAREARRRFDAENAKLMEAHEARRAKAEEEAYQRRKAEKAEADERDLRRSR